jgi:hypothetical protein
MVGYADLLRISELCPDIPPDQAAKLCGMQKINPDTNQQKSQLPNAEEHSLDEGLVEPASPCRLPLHSELEDN